jgi:hypothetical protein
MTSLFNPIQTVNYKQYHVVIRNCYCPLYKGLGFNQTGDSRNQSIPYSAAIRSSAVVDGTRYRC